MWLFNEIYAIMSTGICGMQKKVDALDWLIELGFYGQVNPLGPCRTGQFT